MTITYLNIFGIAMALGNNQPTYFSFATIEPPLISESVTLGYFHGCMVKYTGNTLSLDDHDFPLEEGTDYVIRCYMSRKKYKFGFSFLIEYYIFSLAFAAAGIVEQTTPR